jgi:mono/diheme cytochrome c family protein
MPPFASVLSDAQIAAILTYIRGNTAWGNNASPVTPEQVRAVRQQTADRDRYWSADELLAIPASD